MTLCARTKFSKCIAGAAGGEPGLLGTPQHAIRFLILIPGIRVFPRILFTTAY
jgi:hypothetical protein